jgi:glycosyltransferase involved in cell wall biosynthesis
VKKSIICQLSDFSPEYPGSFVDALLFLARHCRETLKTETLCVFPERARDRKWLRIFDNEGIKYAFIPSKKNVVFALKRLLDDFQPLIFHCHFVTFDLSAVVLKLIKYRRAKVVWHFHSVTSFNFSQWAKDTIKVKFLGCNFADRFIAVSEGVTRNALERGFPQNKLVTNHNGISIQRFVPNQKERQRARDFLGISDRHTVFLHLGYDPLIKGVDVFVKACATFVKNGASETELFLIIGRKQTKEYVSQMSESVSLAANLRVIDPIEDFPSVLNGIDVLVSSSRTEGFGYAIFEAMTANKIVLCSDIPGTSETCGREEGVWLFPSENWCALSKLMEAVRDLTPLTRERLGRANARFVAEHYSLESWAHRMGEVYRSLLVS